MDIGNRFRELELKIEALSQRIAVKEEILNHFASSNMLLQESIKSKWTFVQSLVAFITLLFAINFGYELYKVKEVRDIWKEAKDAVEALQKEEEEFRVAAARQADIIAHVTTAASGLSVAFREYDRKNFFGAAKLADDIAVMLQRDLQRIDDESSRYEFRARKVKSFLPASDTERSSDTEKAASAPAEPQTLAYQNLVVPMKLAVQDALIAALTLKARSLFYGKNPQGTIAVGEKLQKLAPDRWEGYHFVGVALLESDPSGKDSDKKIFTNLEKAFEFRRELTIDALNLAELYFMRGDIKKSKEWVHKYEESTPKPIPPAFETLLVFYTVIDDYLLGKDRGPALRFIDGLRKSKVDLSGSYSAEGLKSYLEGDEYKKLSTEQKNTVKAAVEALDERTRPQAPKP